MDVTPVPTHTWKHWMFGDYNYKLLCTPRFPYFRGDRKAGPPPLFFGRNAHLGFFTAMLMGAQHALAMVGGLIVPPLLIVPFTIPLQEQIDAKQYLVQAALIVAGIMTLFQVTGFRYGRFQWGAGILSVMGVSFTTVPIAQNILRVLMTEHGKTFHEAYGALLGTLAFCGITPLFYSLMPIKVLRKLFPPCVTGVTIVLIGIGLTGSGINNWGGGAFCAAHQVPGDVTGGTGFQRCSGNGDVFLPFGSQQYVGLGLLTFCTIIITEIFGSPFLRNCASMIGLLTGYLVAAVTSYHGNRYVTKSGFDNAPGITFLWTTHYPLSFYAPAIIPLFVVFSITSIENIGDTTATLEASRELVVGEEYALRIKGALFNDGISGIFSALATSLPLTTFAQNNGVISLTNVAARQAGWACGVWLLVLGILGKVGAFITSIPNCVFGGMTTFLFANVIASGVKLIISDSGSLTRRNRFIMACSFGLGIGVTLQPGWGNGIWLWPVTPDMNSGVRGLRDAITLILGTGFCLGAIIAFILNLILPEDEVDKDLLAYEAHMHASRHIKDADHELHPDTSPDASLGMGYANKGMVINLPPVSTPMTA